jgi:hypothetical protein
MFIVYKISNPTTGEYYINFTSKDLSEVLKKKLSLFLKAKEWAPYYVLFDEDTINIEKLCTFEYHNSCLDFIRLCKHYNAGCINDIQNSKYFFE